MKCFALWVNDDGAAQVAELSPEQGQSLIDQVEAQPAESAEQAVQLLQEMISSEPDEGDMEDMMRGYGKAKTMGGGMSPQKVFGDE